MCTLCISKLFLSLKHITAAFSTFMPELWRERTYLSYISKVTKHMI